MNNQVVLPPFHTLFSESTELKCPCCHHSFHPSQAESHVVHNGQQLGGSYPSLYNNRSLSISSTDESIRSLSRCPSVSSSRSSISELERDVTDFLTSVQRRGVTVEPKQEDKSGESMNKRLRLRPKPKPKPLETARVCHEDKNKSKQTRTIKPHLTGRSKRQRVGPSCDLCRSKKIKCDSYVVILREDVGEDEYRLSTKNEVVDEEVVSEFLSVEEREDKYKLLFSGGKLLKFRNCSYCEGKGLEAEFTKGFTKDDVMMFNFMKSMRKKRK